MNVGGVAQLVASRPVAITNQMRPMVSDYTADSRSVKVNSLAVTPLVFATSGTYESNVKDATDPRAVWRTLDPIIDTPAGTAVVLQTRAGNTATPDASWSGYQPPGAGGAIQSPADATSSTARRSAAAMRTSRRPSTASISPMTSTPSGRESPWAARR